MTTAFLTLLLFGLVLATVVRRSREEPAGAWWIAGFLLGASGFLLPILVPTPPGSLLRIVVNTLFLTAYGCCHLAGRCLAGRDPKYWSVAIAFAAWPVLIAVFSPSFETRVLISSMLICGYSAALAIEFAHGATKEGRNRIIAAALCGAHAFFYLIRALVGPTLGLVDASSDTFVSAWGAVIALEGVLFAAALAVLVVGIALERGRLEDRRAAYTDFLTGIGNRRAFETAMHSIIPALDDRVPTTLLLLDLDKFKEVNDRFGHDVGDRLLETFARVVSEQLSDRSMFWRLGGDEFAILLRGCDLQKAALMKETLRHAITISAEIQQITGGVQVSVSIGSAAIIPGETVSDLVQRADTALYDEKSKRRRLGLALPYKSTCAA